MTTRVTERDQLTSPASNDKILIVDTSDLAASADGTDKYIEVVDLLNKSTVTHYNDNTITKALDRWLGEFDDAIKDLISKTNAATTSTAGITKRSTDAQAQGQTSTDTALSPSNLAALQATESLMGLLKVASITDLQQGTSNEVAATPKGIFDSIMGTSVLGNSSQVFNVPFKNTAGDVLMHLKVQFFDVTSDSVYTSANPTDNYNHIHPYFDVTGTFPEPFPNSVLMVLPMGLDISGEATGSDFWCRHHSSTLADAVVRCTRINGTGPRDPVDQAKVRIMAIGY